MCKRCQIMIYYHPSFSTCLLSIAITSTILWPNLRNTVILPSNNLWMMRCVQPHLTAVMDELKNWMDLSMFYQSKCKIYFIVVMLLSFSTPLLNVPIVDKYLIIFLQNIHHILNPSFGMEFCLPTVRQCTFTSIDLTINWV